MSFSQTPHTASGGEINTMYIAFISVCFIFIKGQREKFILLYSDYGNNVYSGQAVV